MYDTLGEIAERLKEMRDNGVTLESLLYTINQVYYEEREGGAPWPTRQLAVRCDAALIGPDVPDIPCERNANHAGVHAGADGARRVTWKD